MKVTKKTRLLAWEPIAQTSDGQVKVKSLTENGQSETLKWGNTWKLDGKGFSGTPKDWFPELAMIRRMPNDDNISCSVNRKSSKLMELVAPEGMKPTPGVYPNAMLTVNMAYTTPDGDMHVEGLNFPIKLVIE